MKASTKSSSKEYFGAAISFADGACSGNPGRGGWGAVVVTPGGQVQEAGGRSRLTTNNQMELTAAIEALLLLQNEPKVFVFTDSTYVIRGITAWIFGWKKRDWKTPEGKDVANQDIWKELDKTVWHRKKQGFETEWRYVRGHTGVPGNERVDEIAVGFSKGSYVQLYSGPLLQYEVAVYDLPENMDLPEMKPKNDGPKKEAHSYLSFVGGELMRHKTWKECEGRVKGRPGAKFKKAMSAPEEATIADSWGVDLNKIKDNI